MVPVVLLALLAALIIGDPGRIDRQKPWLRVTTGAVIALLTLANLFAAARLVGDIITTNKLFAANATALLATGGVISHYAGSDRPVLAGGTVSLSIRFGGSARRW